MVAKLASGIMFKKLAIVILNGEFSLNGRQVIVAHYINGNHVTDPASIKEVLDAIYKGETLEKTMDTNIPFVGSSDYGVQYGHDIFLFG